MSEEIKITDEILLSELRKRFEYNKNAVDELQKLNEELTKVNKKLSASEALKSHFISNITNEIINPFASILGLARSILQIKEGNWPKVKSMANLIFTEAFILDFQLKNIFAAAEIEAGETTLHLSKTRLEEVISNVIELFKHEADKKQIAIKYNCEQRVNFITDSEKIRIILSNLLSNAIKFSPNGSEVFVKLTPEDEQVIITVEDHGIGISPENKTIIFDRFQRLDSGINSLNRGHGLGLSINKAYLDMLSGTIELESKESEYTIFTIKLPHIKEDDSIVDYSDDGDELFFGDSEIF